VRLFLGYHIIPEDADAAGYQLMLGVVMQDGQLFAGSIADNISFFSAFPDSQRIAECATLAAVHDDIATMSMGYHTLIGDMGTVLSGSQKQRVLIARALCHPLSILLLDEATGHLDICREQAINAALGAAHVTRILIAHRPETILAAHCFNPACNLFFLVLRVCVARRLFLVHTLNPPFRTTHVSLSNFGVSIQSPLQRRRLCAHHTILTSRRSRNPTAPRS
jgi:ABC-type nitrate/sulfonate/bicarbonate transport system ATPase subunit